MNKPQLLTTTVEDETYADVTYHIRGELVPELAMELNGGQTVFFEHHVLLWKTKGIDINLRRTKGGLKRKIAGLPLLLVEAAGRGQVAFSRDGTGHVFALHLNPGQVVETREHQYIAATSNMEYDFTRIKGIGSLMFGGNGFFLDKFTCGPEPGILWLHGYGNVLMTELGHGEAIDVEPGAFLFKDPTVAMEARSQGMRSGIFGSGNFIWNRFTGPGRIAIQTMSVHLLTETETTMGRVAAFAGAAAEIAGDFGG